MGRVKYAARNIMFGYLSNAITGILGIALQKIFIIKLGETLLGVNSTYTSILSVLSLAELGLGTAVNFSLYGPVARGDQETVKAYMQFYKKAYRVIALVVACVGLLLVPFLKFIIKDPVGIDSNADLIDVRILFTFFLLLLCHTVHDRIKIASAQTNILQPVHFKISDAHREDRKKHKGRQGHCQSHDDGPSFVAHERTLCHTADDTLIVISQHNDHLPSRSVRLRCARSDPPSGRCRCRG